MQELRGVIDHALSDLSTRIGTCLDRLLVQQERIADALEEIAHNIRVK